MGQKRRQASKGGKRARRQASKEASEQGRQACEEASEQGRQASKEARQRASEEAVRHGGFVCRELWLSCSIILLQLWLNSLWREGGCLALGGFGLCSWWLLAKGCGAMVFSTRAVW